MTQEIWKSVESVPGILVSNLGRAKRLECPIVYADGRKGTLPEKMLAGSVLKAGYITINRGTKKILLHKLIAEAFLGKPKDEYAKQTVNHLNGDKRDNRPENLEWASYKRNNDHARETGLCNQHGEKTNLSKYSDQFIQAVRNVHAKYQPKYTELGAMFGLTGCHARQIVLYQTRKKPTL